MEHELDVTLLTVLAASALVWSLLSARLERVNISAPMAFVVLGLVSTHGPLAVIDVHLSSSIARSVAELTLALVLFVDASRVNVRALRRDAALPTRLLAIGLPLTIGAGLLVAAGLYQGVGLWVVAVIATSVAPTDAALGAAIMGDTRVPGRIRRVLNVESGLNDGIATPFVGICLAGAATSEAIAGSSGIGGAALDLLGGAGLGVAVGLGTALLLRLAVAHGFSLPAFRPLVPLASALLAYAGAVQVGANGFIAAFVAGMAFGTLLPPDLEPTIEFTNVVGELLSLLMWFVVGAAMLVPAFRAAQWQDVVFALLALTVVRMAPVAIACVGLGLDRRTVAFIGWFGPRGLASVIFALLAFDTLDDPDGRRVLAAVTITVVASVIAHGVSASPLAARYGASITARRPHGPESGPTPHLATRSLPGRARAAPRTDDTTAGGVRWLAGGLIGAERGHPTRRMDRSAPRAPLGCVIGIEQEFGVMIEPADVTGPVGTPGGLLMRCGGFGDPVASPGQYLENGARFYMDCGDHPEYATPECASPRELLAAESAGSELVADLAREAERQLSAHAGRPVRVRVLRNNVAPNATTWGTHENYLVPAELSWVDLALPLASHLASRPVFAGAGTVLGGLSNSHARRFRLSQRAPYVGGVVASSTLTVPVGKPMVMARDEPLADPTRFRRLQVVCGDASQSHTATLLKVGTTLMALRLIRHGATPRLTLDDPVAALQSFSADPTLRVTAPSNRGRVRATDVQRAWLCAARRFHERVGLPPHEAELLESWDDVLTSLETDPRRAADRVDWVAKLMLLERLVEREGLRWDDPRVAVVDLAYHDVRAERSVYGCLARAGRMRLLVDDAEVARLRADPPPDARAAARGTLIRLLRRCGYRYEVNWTTCQFTAGEDRVELLLDDPLCPFDGAVAEVISRLARQAGATGSAHGGDGAEGSHRPWPEGTASPSRRLEPRRLEPVTTG